MASLQTELNPFGGDDGLDELGIPMEPPRLEIPAHLKPLLPSPMKAEDVVATPTVMRGSTPEKILKQIQSMKPLLEQRANTQRAVTDMKDYWENLGYTGDSMPVDSAGTPYMPEGPPSPEPAMQSHNWLRTDQKTEGMPGAQTPQLPETPEQKVRMQLIKQRAQQDFLRNLARNKPGGV